MDVQGVEGTHVEMQGMYIHPSWSDGFHFERVT